MHSSALRLGYCHSIPPFTFRVSRSSDSLFSDQSSTPSESLSPSFVVVQPHFMAVHNIVVVGANFAGTAVAHYLLRHTIPALEAQKDQSTTYKVTLISPSTHFFWKISAPRVLVKPDLIPPSKAFLPLDEAFKKYPSEKFALVLGSATALDEQRRTVTVDPLAPASITSVSYDSLVIATGTTSTSALWTLHGSHETSVKELEQVHQLFPKASTILIAGGGPAGVETAGEFSELPPDRSGTDILQVKSGPSFRTPPQPFCPATSAYCLAFDRPLEPMLKTSWPKWASIPSTTSE